MDGTDALRRVEDKIDTLTGVVMEVKGSLVARVDQHQTILDDHEKRLRELEQQPDNSVDHEARIRGLERFRYAWPSVALIAALADAGVLVYYLAGRH